MLAPGRTWILLAGTMPQAQHADRKKLEANLAQSGLLQLGVRGFHDRSC